MKFTWPINKKVTQGFNPSSTRAWYKSNYGINGHNGLDFSCPVGTPIYASADGKVSYSAKRSGGSESIEINHGPVVTTYDHLSVRLVKTGEVVKRDQLIGRSGNTGKSTGPHLHFGFIPQPKIDNGFWGGIDPTKWLQTTKEINAEIKAIGDEAIKPYVSQIASKDKVITDLNKQLTEVRQALEAAENKPPEKIIETVEKIVEVEKRVEVKEPLTIKRAVNFVIDWLVAKFNSFRKDK